MKSGFAGVLLLAGILASPGAWASVEAVFIPAGASEPAASLRARVAGLPGVEAAEPVFSAGEKEYLASSGEGAMGSSLRLRLTDEEALIRLKRRTDLGGRVELDPRVSLHSYNSEQWGLHNTGAAQEVEITDILSRFLKSVPGEDAGVAHAPAELATHKVLVAVIDTGVEAAHPAIAPVLHQTASECKALQAYKECIRTQTDKEPCHQRFANLDTDGNGYPLDCSGWNMLGEKSTRTGLAGSNEPKDDVGHGTHVAGIIAGTGFVSGVASQVEILPVKVLGSGVSGEGSALDDHGGDPDPHGPEFVQDSVVADVVARGVLYAIRSHAQVMNLSLGYPIHDDSELMRRMVALAQSHGILVVAAAGNQSSRTPVYPCRYPGVICVASFSSDGSVSHFSDYGDSVDLAAPGHKILSSWPTIYYPSFFTERRGYDFKSGTSMAAPFVTGALARLLNHGFSSHEAYARLLLGTRPSLPPSVMPELERKFTLSGNLDLARAFAVEPQPLILPALKESVLVPLDRLKGGDQLRSAAFKLALKNSWRDGAGITVSVAISADSPEARARLSLGARGEGLTQTFALWPSGETRTLEGALGWSVPAMELPGEFYFEVTVSAPGMPARSFKKSVEFVVPVRPLAADAVVADSRVVRIATDVSASSLPDDYAMKPITCLPSSEGAAAHSSDDLLLITKTGHSTILQLLALQGEGVSRRLKRTGGDLLDQTKEQLFAFSCLDYDRDGARDYVVTTLDKTDKKFVLTFFDSLFRHGRGMPKLELSSDTVTMPEDFRWIAGIGAGKALTPVFVARGHLPSSELPAFDPWEHRPAELVNPADQRLYYVDAGGLHTLKAPEGFHYVGLLKPTRQELREGTATVLLFKGQDFVLDFYVAKLQGLALSEPSLVEFPIYQRLFGLKTLPVLTTDTAGVSGTAFVEEGAAGLMRLSLKPLSDALGANRLRSWVLAASKPGDLLTEVIAMFGDAGGEAQAFSRSRFQLYFHDSKTGQTLGTDLKQYDSVTRHLPVRVDGAPALLIPEGQASSITTEVILPDVVDGKAQLVRPAALKTIGLDGCELIQMRATGVGGAGGGSSETPDKLTYYCGDHFVQIGL